MVLPGRQWIDIRIITDLVDRIDTIIDFGLVTGISGTITIPIGLIRIRGVRTVVSIVIDSITVTVEITDITYAIAIGIRLRRVGN